MSNDSGSGSGSDISSSIGIGSGTGTNNNNSNNSANNNNNNNINVNIVNSSSRLVPDANRPLGCFDKDNIESRQSCPNVNLPEKILFVIDCVRERNCTPFKLSTGAMYTPLFMMKRVVENFVHIKSNIQRSHEYALMTLNSESARWICDFTSNANSIANQLDHIEEEVLEENQTCYNIGQAFEKIQSRLSQCLPAKRHSVSAAPNFVARVILMYSRSNSVPKLYSKKKCLNALVENPYFFVDTLYVHEPPSSENFCDQIYLELANLDATKFSYALEVGRNAAKLHDNMAKLLAHPLQRSLQRDVRCAIYSSSSSQEVHTNV